MTAKQAEMETWRLEPDQLCVSCGLGERWLKTLSQLAELVCFPSLHGVNTQLLTWDVEGRLLSHQCHLPAAPVPPSSSCLAQPCMGTATPQHTGSASRWDKVSQSLKLSESLKSCVRRADNALFSYRHYKQLWSRFFF